MMKSKSVVLTGMLACAMTFVGCVSVESTRAQLQSSNPTEVAQGEQTAVQAAIRGVDSTGFKKFSTTERVAFVKLLRNPETLMDIVERSGNEPEIRQAALDQIDFKGAVVSMDKDEQYRRGIKDAGMAREGAALAFVKRFGSDEKIAAGTAMTRALDAMSEAELSGLVLRDGRSLHKAAMHQCTARLAATTTDPKVLVHILNGNDFDATEETRKVAARKAAGLKDNRTLLRLLASDDAETIMREMKAERLCELICCEEVGEENSKLEDAVKTVLEHVQDNALLVKVVSEAKRGWVARQALGGIKDPKALLGIARNATPETRARIWALTNDQDVVLELLKGDMGLVRDESAAKKIESQKVAEYLLGKLSLSGLTDRTDWKYGHKMEFPAGYQGGVIIGKIVKHLGADKIGELAAKATAKANGLRAKKTVFDDFYLGMPALDFYVLARAKGVEPDDTIEKKGATGDWRKDFVVTCFEFKAKDRAKLFPCEDELVLRQVVHQCVLHKEGKARAFEHSDLVKPATKVETSWNGHLEINGWWEYSNSGEGILIRYSHKDYNIIFFQK